MVKALSREPQELVSPNALFTARLERRFGRGPFQVEGETDQGSAEGIPMTPNSSSPPIWKRGPQSPWPAHRFRRRAPPG